MEGLDYLMDKRADLDARLDELVNTGTITSEQKEVELSAYDRIVDAKEMRIDAIKESAKRTVPEYHHQLDDYDRHIAQILTRERLEELLADYTPEKAKAILGDARKALIEDGAEDSYVHSRQTQIIKHSKQYGHLPAYIIVTHYNPQTHHIRGIVEGTGVFQNGQYVQNAKIKTRTIIGKKIGCNELAAKHELAEISKEDGAVLVDLEGKIAGTNAELETKHEELDNKGTSLNKIIGISSGNTRQHAGFFASKNMPGTAVYVLGEETPIIRRFSYGLLTWSSDDDEDLIAKENLKLLKGKLSTTHLNNHSNFPDI